MKASSPRKGSFFHDFPVSTKIRSIVFVSSLVTLLLLCIITVFRERQSFEKRKVNELATLSRVLEHNTAASLRFDDSVTAQKYVDSFNELPEVQSVTIYRETGEVFAYFSRNEAFHPFPAPSQYGERWSDNRLFYSKAISINDQPLGKILIELDRSPLRAEILKSIWLSVALFLGGLTLSVLLATRLQSFLHKPIEELVGLTRKITQNKSFQDRAVKFYNDEIGVLADSINQMLDTIDHQDEKLRHANASLERAVIERTEDLRLRNLELNEAIDKAKAASSAKSEFLAIASHELRTPLNPIIGYVEKLLVDEGNPKRAKELRTIKQSAEFLLRLIEDILEFSRVERGNIRLSKQQISPEQFCKDIVYFMSPEAEFKGLKLLYEETDCEEDSRILVTTDPGRLRQIILNLIGNALKFTPAGTITIRSKIESEKENSGKLHIQVEDTGIGIKEEDLEMLFEPFSQVDGSLSRQYGGMGLGLAICKKFVEALKGSISCKSIPGAGSCFEFEIPVDIVKDGNLDLNEPSASPPLLASAKPDKPILLVEDEIVNRELGASLLKSLGYSVATAADGYEAIEQVKEQDFCLVLLDLRMPGLDGFETARELRKLDDPKNRLPIIAVTAHVSSDDKDKCLASGMDDYLPKPLSIQTLGERLEKWLTPSETLGPNY